METPTNQPHLDHEAEESVINVDVRRYLAAIRRYAWMIAALFAVAIAGAILYTTNVTPIYEAKASVQIEPRLPDLLGTGDLFNVAAAGGNSSEYYKQQKQVLGSFKLAQQTIIDFDLVGKFLTDAEQRTLSSQERLDEAALRFVNMLSIKYPDQDRIMYVYVRSPSPDLAMLLANNHVTTYVNYAKGLLSMSSSSATGALQAEFTQAEAKLRAAENAITDFQAKNKMIAVTLEEQQKMVAANILTVTTKYLEARGNEITIGNKLTEMKKELASIKDFESSPIPMMAANTSFDMIRIQYRTEKNKLTEMERELGPKNLDRQAQKQKVDELYAALKSEVEMLIAGTRDQYTAAVKTSQDLAAEVQRFKDEATALSPMIARYNVLTREKKLIEDEYNILKTRLTTTQLTGNMSSVISNVHPLDPALLPSKPVSPRLIVNLIVAFVIALLFSSLVIFLLVFLDRSIKTPLDAQQAAAAPVLGFIPALPAKSEVRSRDMFVHEHPTSHVAECCRALRTNVMFSAATGSTDGRELKTFVICSANAQEGKTTTVIYLGTTMAQSGQRVLLIDSDMRRPRLHVSTDVRREPGLSNLLLGDDDYDSMIKPTAVPNLFVLPCGPLPPNPAELLMTKRFEHVLDELGKRFTKIILDSPPLQPVTDGIVLARRAEGVILVVRSGRTIRDELKRSSRMIRSVNGRIFGVVVNDRHERERSKYYYHYGSYGYRADEAAAAGEGEANGDDATA